MEKSFSETLKEYKALHSLTQREMAERMGISERMYANYESGAFTGTPKKVAQYLQKLSCNFHESNIVEESQEVYQTNEAANLIKRVAELEKEMGLKDEIIELQRDIILDLRAKLVNKATQ